MNITTIIEKINESCVAKPAAVRVLQEIDNPRNSMQQIAGVLSADPVLSAQVMRLANSAYYGLSGKVSNIVYAVNVIGLSAVRSIVAVSAAGLDKKTTLKPEGFWEHSALTAVASSVAAGTVGAARNDAFSCGLLHDLGAVLLCGYDPDTYPGLYAEHGDTPALAEAETLRYGVTHDQVTGIALTAWKFPSGFVNAAVTHHQPDGNDPLAVAVHVGDLIAHHVAGTLDATGRLDRWGFTSEDVDRIAGHAQEEAAAITAMFN